MKFKKGELTKEVYDVIMHDLGCLQLQDTEDNKYHYNLLKGNLQDIFGRNDKMDEEEDEYGSELKR